ncbi:MAG: hypothetical protein DRP62_07905 [Planctomycetota bacterium]|nr:MAG: hypothetical protein DRP62_07905 [Planctomycetota bacterium]
MDQQKLCQDCNRSHNCQKVYQQLGGIKGPSVAVTAVVAFLMPLMVFIAALAIFEKVLSGFEMAAGLRTVFSIVVSLLVTTLCVLIMKTKNTPQK